MLVSAIVSSLLFSCILSSGRILLHLFFRDSLFCTFFMDSRKVHHHKYVRLTLSSFFLLDQSNFGKLFHCFADCTITASQFFYQLFQIVCVYKRPVSFSIQLFFLDNASLDNNTPYNIFAVITNPSVLLFFQKQRWNLIKAEIFSLCIVKIVQSHHFFSSLLFSNVKGNILERDPPYMKVYAAHK